MSQIKNAFDQQTVVKILKGAAIAGGAVFIIYLLEALTSLQFGNYTALVVGVLSVIINAIKEFRKGEKTE